MRGAIEIQRFYSEMRRKGFAFNKGLRVALNYGYYRLLPMKTSFDSNERITEFYGPGIVELSRLNRWFRRWLMRQYFARYAPLQAALSASKPSHAPPERSPRS